MENEGLARNALSAVRRQDGLAVLEVIGRIPFGLRPLQARGIELPLPVFLIKRERRTFRSVFE